MTVDFTDAEKQELEEYVASIGGCHQAVFVRAAVKFAIASGITVIKEAPPQRKVNGVPLKDAFEP